MVSGDQQRNLNVSETVTPPVDCYYERNFRTNARIIELKDPVLKYIDKEASRSTEKFAFQDM